MNLNGSSRDLLAFSRPSFVLSAIKSSTGRCFLPTMLPLTARFGACIPCWTRDTLKVSQHCIHGDTNKLVCLLLLCGKINVVVWPCELFFSILACGWVNELIVDFLHGMVIGGFTHGVV
jgi:hypothetical protein